MSGKSLKRISKQNQAFTLTKQTNKQKNHINAKNDKINTFCFLQIDASLY